MYSLHCYPIYRGSTKFPQQPPASAHGGEHKNSEFTMIWHKLIAEWDPRDDKLVKCAQSMTRYAPIPSSLRAEAWFVLSGAAELLKNNAGLYEKLHSSPSAHSDLIEKDLPRTWGAHPNFHARKGSIHCLRRILTAYSNFDPTLGYCQGMNYVAGFLLHVFRGSNEEQAFFLFLVIMRQVRSVFIDGLPGFHKLVTIFRKLCRHHLPKLHQHWKTLQIDVYKLILTPWFHSLFSYPCLDCAHTARVWDLFLVHDFSVCMKLAFTIIASNEHALHKMDFVQLIDFCKFLPCMESGSSGAQLIQKSISVKLNEKYLNYTRDLTRFDWQINKRLKKEFQRHQRKRLHKQREKEKMQQKYKTMPSAMVDDAQSEQNDHDETRSPTRSPTLNAEDEDDGLVLPTFSTHEESESVMSSVSMSDSSIANMSAPPTPMHHGHTEHNL